MNKISRYNTEGSLWFRRLIKDCQKISNRIWFKRIKYGFYRIYWDQAYIYEVYKEMPQYGHDIYENDIRFTESKQYYEKHADRAEMTRKIKNFVEGYHEAFDAVRTSAYMMRTNPEHNKLAHQAYQMHVVK